MVQTILMPDQNYRALTQYIQKECGHRLLLVCGHSFFHTKVGQYLMEWASVTKARLVCFSAFHPNPDYESVIHGISVFRQSGCGAIIAAGGGSAMDVAKCIRHGLGENIPLLAIPTTAGSGSEATHFAVVYRQGMKDSVNCSLPDAVLLDPSALDGLPAYQRKATMLDALCHGIESFWSVNSTEESRMYSKEAIQLTLSNMEGYLRNRPKENAGMQQGAYRAGQAINLAQTTAGHAMSYRITKLYGIAHGHAAALCIAKLWPYLLHHLDECNDPRGYGYLNKIQVEIAKAMDLCTPWEGAERFQAILDDLNLEVPTCSTAELSELTSSVNLTRLKNFPVMLSSEAVRALYQQILREGG